MFSACHLSNKDFNVSINQEDIKLIPFFEVSRGESTFYLPSTSPTSPESFLYFLAFLKETNTGKSLENFNLERTSTETVNLNLLDIKTRCDMIEFAFSLGCDGIVNEIADHIAKEFLALNFEKVFGFPIHREMLSTMSDEKKMEYQEKILTNKERMYPEWTLHVYNLPFLLKQEIFNRL